MFGHGIISNHSSCIPRMMMDIVVHSVVDAITMPLHICIYKHTYIYVYHIGFQRSPNFGVVKRPHFQPGLFRPRPPNKTDLWKDLSPNSINTCESQPSIFVHFPASTVHRKRVAMVTPWALRITKVDTSKFYSKSVQGYPMFHQKNQFQTVLKLKF